jgi:hypothetical protein
MMALTLRDLGSNTSRWMTFNAWLYSNDNSGAGRSRIAARRARAS